MLAWRLIVVLVVAVNVSVVGADASRAEALACLADAQFQKDVLSGFLIVPEGLGPFPAFVIIQGSSSSSLRTSWEADHFPFWKDITEELARRGFEVLGFDKPGVGGSTGAWWTQAGQPRLALNGRSREAQCSPGLAGRPVRPR